MENNFVIIMAGGIGSRFWPVSTAEYPKQFQDILGTGQTMLQQTVERFEGICPNENIYIVTNRDYIPLVKKQLPFLKDEQILGEPFGRNTAPCIAYACYKIQSKNGNANIVVSPADHVVLRQDIFKATINKALTFTASDDFLVTLGINPSRPDTGYGYIQFEDKQSNPCKVKTFTEKPSLEIAQKFLESGDFLWNAGIFVWNVNSIIKQFEIYLPDMDELFFEGNSIWYSPMENEFIDKVYQRTANISIDYAILEKAKNVFVLKSDFGWSDLGTWNSLYTVKDKNDSENVFIGGKVLSYDSKGNLIKINANNLAVIQGLENYIVVQHNNVLMICQRNQEQMVKTFVSDLEKVNSIKKGH